ncbi:hypothetical protein C8J57DRAFT_1250099 [Mycena rebaudengoi]|nr:hypothetical protein C8J57DRAFT_1250099 [Mycena rebaudengoi]
MAVAEALEGDGTVWPGDCGSWKFGPWFLIFGPDKPQDYYGILDLHCCVGGMLDTVQNMLGWPDLWKVRSGTSYLASMLWLKLRHTLIPLLTHSMVMRQADLWHVGLSLSAICCQKSQDLLLKYGISFGVNWISKQYRSHERKFGCFFDGFDDGHDGSGPDGPPGEFDGYSSDESEDNWDSESNRSNDRSEGRRKQSMLELNGVQVKQGT